MFKSWKHWSFRFNIQLQGKTEADRNIRRVERWRDSFTLTRETTETLYSQYGVYFSLTSSSSGIWCHMTRQLDDSPTPKIWRTLGDGNTFICIFFCMFSQNSATICITVDGNQTIVEKFLLGKKYIYIYTLINNICSCPCSMSDKLFWTLQITTEPGRVLKWASSHCLSLSSSRLCRKLSLYIINGSF